MDSNGLIRHQAMMLPKTISKTSKGHKDFSQKLPLCQSDLSSTATLEDYALIAHAGTLSSGTTLTVQVVLQFILPPLLDIVVSFSSH